MGDVVDVRPDRFLHEMREHGDWAKACEKAGFTLDEAERLCLDNPKFDFAQVECHLEQIEESLTEEVERVIAEAKRRIANARSALVAHLTAGRAAAMEAYRARHG